MLRIKQTFKINVGFRPGHRKPVGKSLMKPRVVNSDLNSQYSVVLK